MENKYKNVRKILEDGGTRFDYIFDCLKALDVAVENKDPAYLREKIRLLRGAADIIASDVEAWARREKIFVE
jgi:hypothetical protein